VSQASPELHAVLRDAQRLGFLGARPVPEVISHARAFVDALHDVDGRVLDLGSGGGVPGLVIAHDRPDLQVTLVDRRTKRTDFLRRVVGRLGWVERVDVAALEATELARLEPHAFAAVVARGYGPPEITLATALELVCPGGVVVISEPPTGDRWSVLAAVRDGVVVVDGRWPQVARFRVASD
jgi:16S rRNA (guanine527-N7)-methyltransferase